MSGGSLDYLFCKLSQTIDTLESWLEPPDPDVRLRHPDSDPEYKRIRMQACREDPEESKAVEAIERALPRLREAERALKAIEYWLSHDYGPERVVKAVAALEKKD